MKPIHFELRFDSPSGNGATICIDATEKGVVADFAWDQRPSKRDIKRGREWFIEWQEEHNCVMPLAKDCGLVEDDAERAKIKRLHIQQEGVQ